MPTGKIVAPPNQDLGLKVESKFHKGADTTPYKVRIEGTFGRIDAKVRDINFDESRDSAFDKLSFVHAEASKAVLNAYGAQKAFIVKASGATVDIFLDTYCTHARADVTVGTASLESEQEKLDNQKVVSVESRQNPTLTQHKVRIFETGKMTPWKVVTVDNVNDTIKFTMRNKTKSA